MWTMAENLDKLKKGRAFANGSPLKGHLMLHETKTSLGIVKDFDTIP